MGLPTPEKKERNQQIYQLHLSGQSYWTIAKKYDLTPQRIAAIIKRIREKLV
jgi:Mor family transcriptional regulator